jgi:UPF0755 protein
MSLDLDRPARRSRRARRERRARRRAVVAVVMALVMLGVLAGGAVWLGRAVFGGGDSSSGDDFAGAGTGSVSVVVERGDTASEIARTLQNAGVVKTAKAFVAAARTSPESASIQPGSYQLRKQMSAADALALLLDPASRQTAGVTIREGLRLDETLDELVKRTGIPLADYRRALANPAAIGLPSYAKGKAEGFLFPATYEIDPGTSATAVLRKMTARFEEAAEATNIASSGKPYDVVIIASIVEAEARAPGDYGKVARVIYNRLQGIGDTGGRLEMDSTVNYILKADKLILDKNDLNKDSPYNTRKNAGLPPGPIGSPGELALRAAAAPPAGDWVYFVTVDKTGLTKFTGDYDQFLKWKAEAKANGVA